jgi:hypothetical protein
MINILPRELIKEILTHTIKNNFFSVTQVSPLFKIISEEIELQQSRVFVISSADMLRASKRFPSYTLKQSPNKDYFSYFYNAGFCTGAEKYYYDFTIGKYYSKNLYFKY